MRAAEIARILRARGVLRDRARWTREQVLSHQGKELGALLEFARNASPYYRRVRTQGAPLVEQPVLTKAGLLDRFDEIATDPQLKLKT